jgi:phenylacetate-CoA ligase
VFGASKLLGLAGLFGAASWSRHATKAFQLRQVQRLVHHAYEHVPFYREHYDRAGLRPGDIHCLEDFERTPVVSREDLQNRPVVDVVARGFAPEKLVLHRTSGSTGEPLNVLRTRFEERLLQAFRLRALLGHGLRVTDRRAADTTVRDETPARARCT